MGANKTSGGIGNTELSTNATAASAHTAWGVAASRSAQSYIPRNIARTRIAR